MRVLRPGWQSVLADLQSGAARAVLAEDLDRVARDPRDLEDLLDAVQGCRGQARSLSGSLRLTDGGRPDEMAMARVMVAMASKASSDTSRRVADGRERSARAGSYAGGPRPFGYRADKDAPKGAKTLVVVPAEAAVVRSVAAAIVAEVVPPGGKSSVLAICARELRAGNVPTVSGAPWTALALRDIMCSHAIAGITVNKRTKVETDGAWPAILDRGLWEEVRGILLDPARRDNVGNGNAPRWLGSGLYVCGVCGSTVIARGGKGHSVGYVCKAHAHLRRHAARTDEYVGAVIAARLALPDAADLFRPAATGGDTRALRDEQRRLERVGERMAEAWAIGDMSERDYKAGSRARQARLAEITAQLLAASAGRDPLPEFRDAPTPGKCGIPYRWPGKGTCCRCWPP